MRDTMKQSPEAKTEGDVERVGERIERPWGAWTLLETGPGYRVKRLEVLSGKRLSLQKHFCRSEHWVVVQGTARVTCGNRVFRLKTNQWTFIPSGAVHRLENHNSTPLLVVEVQTGNDLRESDIIRLEDDFGRANTYGSKGHSTDTVNEAVPF